MQRRCRAQRTCSTPCNRCRSRYPPRIVAGNAEHGDAEANGRLGVVFEAGAGAAQQHAGVGAQALEVAWRLAGRGERREGGAGWGKEKNSTRGCGRRRWKQPVLRVAGREGTWEDSSRHELATRPDANSLPNTPMRMWPDPPVSVLLRQTSTTAGTCPFSTSSMARFTKRHWTWPEHGRRQRAWGGGPHAAHECTHACCACQLCRLAVPPVAHAGIASLSTCCDETTAKHAPAPGSQG